MYQSIEEEVYDFIVAAQKVKSYLRIKYKNINDKVTYRTIRDYTCVEVFGKVELSDVGKRKVYRYLVGYCCSKKEERTFKVNRILRIEELNIKYSDVLD